MGPESSLSSKQYLLLLWKTPLNSQHLHGISQLTITPVPGELVPCFDL